MKGLQRATTLNLTEANLSNVPVLLSCRPKNDNASSELCTRLSTLLINQGAELIDDFDERRSIDSRDYFLRLDLQSRIIMKRELGLFVRIVTLDIFEDEPGLDEYAVELKMTLRDRDQLLLAQETLVARFRFELGWENPTPETFSNDLYSQVTQILYNGHLRQRVFSGDPSANITPGTKNP